VTRDKECSTLVCHWPVILQHTLIISSYHMCSTVTYLFCIISCLIWSLNHALHLHIVNSTSHSTTFILLTHTAVSPYLLYILWVYVFITSVLHFYSLQSAYNSLFAICFSPCPNFWLMCQNRPEIHAHVQTKYATKST